tara:strand:- start:1854 stop:2585 length:732 start_codon:yes stop_codon:yes gene_type:complete
MAGHSKWSTIKRKKGALDQKRGKIFSTISKEITISSRLGGKDVDSNPRLRQAIKKAKSLNMPNSNIEKAVKKGVGEIDNVIFEEVDYEGYGPFGVAVYIEAITDNKNRTVADVRHSLTKFDGSLGQTGSVSWNFDRVGTLIFDKDSFTEDELFELSIENNAKDFIVEEDCYKMIFNHQEMYDKIDYFEKKQLIVENSYFEYIAKDLIEIDKNQEEKVSKMINFLEELEDVQNVYTNYYLSKIQ